MPHLAPLNWLMFPSILLMIIYAQLIFLYFMTPSTFPKTKETTPKFSPWSW